MIFVDTPEFPKLFVGIFWTGSFPHLRICSNPLVCNPFTTNHYWAASMAYPPIIPPIFVHIPPNHYKTFLCNDIIFLNENLKLIFVFSECLFYPFIWYAKVHWVVGQVNLSLFLSKNSYKITTYRFMVQQNNRPCDICWHFWIS